MSKIRARHTRDTRALTGLELFGTSTTLVHTVDATPSSARGRARAQSDKSDWTLEAEDGRCATRKWFTEILFTSAGPAQ